MYFLLYFHILNIIKIKCREQCLFMMEQCTLMLKINLSIFVNFDSLITEEVDCDQPFLLLYFICIYLKIISAQIRQINHKLNYHPFPPKLFALLCWWTNVIIMHWIIVSFFQICRIISIKDISLNCHNYKTSFLYIYKKPCNFTY